MPTTLYLPLHFERNECLSHCLGVLELTSQDVSGEYQRQLRIFSGVRLRWSISYKCKAEELKRAHISIEGGFKFDAAPESSSHLQVIQTNTTDSQSCAILQSYVPSCTLYKQACTHRHAVWISLYFTLEGNSREMYVLQVLYIYLWWEIIFGIMKHLYMQIFFYLYNFSLVNSAPAH